MPDILFIPSTATPSEITDLSDRLNLGDMLIMHGRVYGLIAHSTMALSQNNCLSKDRRFFASMDALMRVDQGRMRELLENVHETQQNQGYRLNAIDGRLALIEKHTGMVKA
jgi:hypothetical protein